jgi:DNA-directed RNA polymerase subunit M/transcription elongation factor TFIIS
MTPEEKTKYIEKVTAEQEKMKKAVEAVAATDAGKELIKFLHRVCGYDQVNLVMNRQTGEVDTVATTFNECRRGVYIQIRNLVPAEVLKEIEFAKTEEKK